MTLIIDVGFRRSSEDTQQSMAEEEQSSIRTHALPVGPQVESGSNAAVKHSSGVVAVLLDTYCQIVSQCDDPSIDALASVITLNATKDKHSIILSLTRRSCNHDQCDGNMQGRHTRTP